jgi:hypothetical protein
MVLCSALLCFASRGLSSWLRNGGLLDEELTVSRLVVTGISVSVVMFGVFNPKYSQSILSRTAVSPYQICWITAYAVATLYTWFWDGKGTRMRCWSGSGEASSKLLLM